MCFVFREPEGNNLRISRRIFVHLGYQLKAGYFPLFGGFASLNPPCKVQLVADVGWIKERKLRIHQSNCYRNAEDGQKDKQDA